MMDMNNEHPNVINLRHNVNKYGYDHVHASIQRLHDDGLLSQTQAMLFLRNLSDLYTFETGYACGFNLQAKNGEILCQI